MCETIEWTTIHIYPDGTLQDVFKLARGYWEAKDTNDDLDAEIQKKIAKKYPPTNTIFEDTEEVARKRNERGADGGHRQ